MMQAAGARGSNCLAMRRARGSVGARVAAALCAALSGLWAAQRADAAVDLNGLWDVGLYVTRSALTLSDHCSLTITQTGDQLELSGNCQGAANPVVLSGSYDPDSHQFTGSGSAGACGAVTMRGVVGADFKAFTGDFDCSAFGVSGGVNASRCGNGQIDEGEECDDGNRANGDCCAAVCKLNRAGTACSDDGSPCTSDVCDATGQCQHIDITGPCDDGNSCTADDTCVSGRCVGTVQPDDSGCDDGNGCTAGDRCAQGLCTADPVVCPACLECNVDRGCVPAITNGCEQASATSIVLRRLSTDSVSWRWQRGDSTSAAALGDPTGRSDYDFCVYDGNADAEGTPGLVLGARAAAGSDWSPSRHGFGYTRADRSPGGLRRVLLNAGSAGKSRLAVKGLGDALALPALQSLTLPLTVQLKTKDGRSTQCWTAEYSPPLMQNPLVLRAGHRTRLPDTRPNILVVNLDDTRADGIDRMPNVARLAAQGVSFTNSFVVNPLCAPSRASLFSGLYSQHNGVLALGGPIGGAHRFRELGGDRQTIAVWMHEAGYRTGMFGKYINGYGFGGTEQVIGAGGTYYVPPGWTRWRAMPSPEHYGGERGGTYNLVDEHGRATPYDDHTNDAQYSTDVLGAEVRSFVSDAVAEGRPFFAVWAPFASHGEVPSFTPEPASRHFDFFHYLPAWRPPSFAEPDVSDKPRGIQALTNNFTVQIFNSLIRVGAYESLLAVDEQLQRIIDALVELGVDDNTVIIFTSDNGSTWGEHRLYSQAKECPYEECLRVPMIVRDPRSGVSGVVREAAVLNIDIAPTVAALAGVVPPVPLDGASFAPWLGATPPPSWRQDFLIEHWRSARGETLDYTGQVSDGDELRLSYGAKHPLPRASVLFEFDDGGGVSAGAVAVPIGDSADATFAALAAAVTASPASASGVPFPDNDRVLLTDDSAAQDGLYLFIERDQGGILSHRYAVGDFYGVRDVPGELTYVEHESGEQEIYDLDADPYQLANKTGDAVYAGAKSRLSGRLGELLP
jgi:cysteine-rich repeat protein